MKDKGIKFNIIDEPAAQHFLEEHNYFFKLSAYRKTMKSINMEKMKANTST